MTLTLLHTAESNRLLFASLLAELAPEIPARHLIRPELLAQAVEQGGVTPEICAAVQEQIRAA